MALVIEDGTGITGANSYVTIDEAKQYLLDRGLSFSGDDATVATLLVKATDYLESYRSRFKGNKVFDGLEFLQWPRYSVYVDQSSDPLLYTAVPILIKNAQCQLAYEIQTVDPLPTSNNAYPVKREKVDVIETEYAVSNNAGPNLPVFPRVEKLLEPLLRWSGLTSVRI